jgi:phosphoglycerol transferase MdoB-like AlkP superfamily enzyme
MESVDYRHTERKGQGPELSAFWERWRQYYGETGFVNPRGDRLLTELTIRALKELRPKLIMVNYNDPDYVHWGNMTHYTRGVAIIDEGLRQLVATVEGDPEYRDNTIFVVVPDCGRDSNPYVAVPCQHHFNSRSAHEIFALVVGPGIQRGMVVDKRVDQIQVASTIGKLMGMPTEFAEKRMLEEVFA